MSTTPPVSISTKPRVSRCQAFCNCLRIWGGIVETDIDEAAVLAEKLAPLVAQVLTQTGNAGLATGLTTAVNTISTVDNDMKQVQAIINNNTTKPVTRSITAAATTSQ